mmetsp:Transcript_53142/g.172829  ORF Transcript_53142/g.172829 Transcript_53142/m.172829 type:complete len:257 (-) Transcript_53142:24-794(-)
MNELPSSCSAMTRILPNGNCMALLSFFRSSSARPPAQQPSTLALQRLGASLSRGTTRSQGPPPPVPAPTPAPLPAQAPADADGVAAATEGARTNSSVVDLEGKPRADEIVLPAVRSLEPKDVERSDDTDSQETCFAKVVSPKWSRPSKQASRWRPPRSVIAATSASFAKGRRAANRLSPRPAAGPPRPSSSIPYLASRMRSFTASSLSSAARLTALSLESCTDCTIGVRGRFGAKRQTLRYVAAVAALTDRESELR